MRIITCLTVVMAVATVVWVSPAQAHPGGLNRDGCHNNRKTGDYHCHRPGGSTSRGSATAPSVTGPSVTGPAPGAYRNCTEARAAGAAPIRAGEPGYGQHLDRDGDGVACEPWRGR